MIVIEVKKNNREILDELLFVCSDEAEIVEVDSLSGTDLIQLIVPLAAVLSPAVFPLFQKLIENQKVTIKFEGIEVTASNKDDAMNILNELISKKNTDKENSNNDI